MAMGWRLLLVSHKVTNEVSAGLRFSSEILLQAQKTADRIRSPWVQVWNLTLSLGGGCIFFLEASHSSQPQNSSLYTLLHGGAAYVFEAWRNSFLIQQSRGAREMAQWVKGLPHKHEDVSSDPHCLCEKSNAYKS